MSTYPKSPRDMTSGMMWFPRMVDKIRLHARGELGEDYDQNLGGGMDKRCLDFLRVDYPALCARVASGGTDEELLEWCFSNGRRLDAGDVFVWNLFVSKFGWNDPATKRLQELKEKLGLTDRAEIITFFDLLDFDEQRRS